MGCGTSKVLPEPPKDVHLDLVKKVEPYTGYKTDIYKLFIKGDGDAIKSAIPSPPCHTNPYVEQQEPRKNRVAKYRAKFDPRVTAKYDIKALIGRGSFSRVVRVEHKATKQPYAIKLIETKYREGREVCESELCVLRRVRHTNIIQLIEVFETQERVYMVMELATGGMDSKIMITDFGLASARKKGDDCLMKTTCGTPEYIAPEILIRKPYTNSVDMWALGVISYILLSGTMPFEDDNRTRLYRQILKGKYSYSGEPWPSVSNLAKDFIDRLLTVDPGDRLTALQALKHPWVVSMAASSSMKNLHRSISQNLLKRASSRCQSTKSAQSTRSSRSTKSNKSRRVRERELRELNLRYQQQYNG
ncbi:serine/threonine-protein kinase H1 isoform X2 [Crotalus tigris]|uniref:serine/threonine-protein kinase H1 isoform X2 n=1 Tax=Crotalus tigris TaxID=88082 RepID=UPI00192F6A77|nr:serine/threonine-protein kinase H1 isoform X2 [Crotalus tigris]